MRKKVKLPVINNKMNKENMIKASMTVELSLLIPFILAVIVFVIFMGFYLHDRCIYIKGYSTALIRAAFSPKEEYIEVTVKEAIDEIENNLTGIWTISPEVTVNNGEITIKGNGAMKLTKGILAFLFDRDNVDYSLYVKGYYIDEVNYVRQRR